MNYKCINAFSVDKCDDDGFTIENEHFSVPKDSVWTVSEDTFRCIDGEIRLDNDKYGWLEMSSKHLVKDFEPIYDCVMDDTDLDRLIKLFKESDKFIVSIIDDMLLFNFLEELKMHRSFGSLYESSRINSNAKIYSNSSTKSVLTEKGNTMKSKDVKCYAELHGGGSFLEDLLKEQKITAPPKFFEMKDWPECFFVVLDEDEFDEPCQGEEKIPMIGIWFANLEENMFIDLDGNLVDTLDTNNVIYVNANKVTKWA